MAGSRKEAGFTQVGGICIGFGLAQFILNQCSDGVFFAQLIVNY
ncbi:hypothetical protein [Aliamphritea spongicola]|nr:hypothetical protein [Aliamphritea spongicola]